MTPRKFWKSAQGKKLIDSKYKAAFLIAFVVILSSPTLADTNIDNCGDLNVSNEVYLLTTDINTSSSSYDSDWCLCMRLVDENNITLDCQGHTIIDDNEDCGGSVQSQFEGSDNSLIKNCNFIEYDESYTGGTGVSFYISDNSTLKNSTISISCSDVSCSDISITGTDNKIFNNKIWSRVKNPNNLSNSWNTTRQIGTRIYSAGTEIGGNYWTNSTANGYSDTCADADTDGFCDDPYDVGNNTACDAIADGLPECGPNTDWLPLSDEYSCVQDWSLNANSTLCYNLTTSRMNETWYDNNLCGSPYEYNYTYFANASCDPLNNLTIAYTYCLTNTTLANINHTNDYGNVTTEYMHCSYGCDNITASCNPPQYQASLIILGIVIIILVALYKVYKWI